MRATWALHPETKPGGVDDASAMQQALTILKAFIPNLLTGVGERWGEYPPGALEGSVQFALDNGLIAKTDVSVSVTKMTTIQSTSSEYSFCTWIS